MFRISGRFLTAAFGASQGGISGGQGIPRSQATSPVPNHTGSASSLNETERDSADQGHLRPIDSIVPPAATSQPVVTPDRIAADIRTLLGRQKVPLSSLQFELSEEIQEELGETWGGLLAFARLRPNDFIVSKSPNGIWLLQNALEANPTSAQRSTSAQPVKVPSAPLAPPPLESPKPAKSLNDGKEKVAPQSVFGENLPYNKVPEHTRAVFMIRGNYFSLPPFAVPLSRVVKELNNMKLNNKFPAMNLSSSSSQERITHETVLEALRIHFSKGSVLLVRYGETLFLATGYGAGDPTTGSTHYADCEVQSYDVCRLARHMSCEQPTSVIVLEEMASHILTRSVGEVLLSAPKRFKCEFTEAGEDWEAALDDEIEALEAKREKACVAPPVAKMEWQDVSSMPLPTSSTPRRGHPPSSSASSSASAKIEEIPISINDLSPAHKLLVRRLKSATFMVTPENLQREAACAPIFANHTLADIQEEWAKFHRREDKGTFKAVKDRRRLIKARLAKEFPLGNPLIEPDVTAHLIYDLIEHCNGYIATDAVRSMLPENGRLCCNTNNDFFRSFPSLFNVVEKSMVNLSIQRADCGPPVTLSPLSKAELVLILISALPSTSLDRGFHIQFLKSTLTKHVVSEMKRQFGTADGKCPLFDMVSAFPTFVTLHLRQDGNHFFTTSTARLKEWEQVTLKELQVSLPEGGMSSGSGCTF